MHSNMSSSTDDETMAQAVVLVDSIMLPMTMKAAIDLGLLEIIAEALLTASEMVEKIPENENPKASEMVERILRLLAAFSVVSCSVEPGGETKKVYGLTTLGRYFVKNEDGVSLAPIMRLINDKVFVDGCYKIKDVVSEGGAAFDKVHGMNAFEYPSTDPRFNDVFNLGMLNYTTIIMNKVLQSYNGFENVDRLVDVGGGLGHTLKIILSKYPNIKGINFDLPHVTKHGLSHPSTKIKRPRLSSDARC